MFSAMSMSIRTGIAGIEKYLDDRGALYTASLADPASRSLDPVQLSIDSASSMRSPMSCRRQSPTTGRKPAAGWCSTSTMARSSAWSRCRTFNPNQPIEAQQKNAGNRMTGGVYELGSVIKAVTFAMALDAGVCDLDTPL